MANGKSLSDIVIELEKAGHDKVDTGLRASQLEKGQKPYLAMLMNSLAKAHDATNNTAMSETKLDRLASGSQEYRDYVNGMVLAGAEFQHKLVRYENLARYYEAKRSELAMERERMKTLKDIT